MAKPKKKKPSVSRPKRPVRKTARTTTKPTKRAGKTTRRYLREGEVGAPNAPVRFKTAEKQAQTQFRQIEVKAAEPLKKVQFMQVQVPKSFYSELNSAGCLKNKNSPISSDIIKDEAGTAKQVVERSESLNENQKRELVGLLDRFEAGTIQNLNVYRKV